MMRCRKRKGVKMKTYEFTKIPLSKEDRFQFDLLSAEYQIKKRAFDNYLLQFICPKVGIDPNKGFIKYDLIKEEFTYEEREQPKPKDKPSESGNK